MSLPDPVFARAELLADRMGVTRSRLYALALEQYLDQADEAAGHDPVTTALDDVHTREQPSVELGAEAARRLIDRGGWDW